MPQPDVGILYGGHRSLLTLPCPVQVIAVKIDWIPRPDEPGIGAGIMADVSLSQPGGPPQGRRPEPALRPAGLPEPLHRPRRPARRFDAWPTTNRAPSASSSRERGALDTDRHDSSRPWSASTSDSTAAIPRPAWPSSLAGPAGPDLRLGDRPPGQCGPWAAEPARCRHDHDLRAQLRRPRGGTLSRPPVPQAEGGLGRSTWPRTRNCAARWRSRRSSPTRPIRPPPHAVRARGRDHRRAGAPRHRAGLRPGHRRDGRPFYAMRFVEGDSLKDAIEAYHREHPGPDPRTVEFRSCWAGSSTCATRSPTRTAGVLHRDLKPDNVMLGKYGETLIVDWGLAKATGQRDESAGGRRRRWAAVGRQPRADAGHARHAGLHEPRAGRGQGRRAGPGDRHLRPGGDALRAPDRPAAGPGRAR